MTVAELIEELRVLPQDLKVVLQRDQEGNGFQKARGVDPGFTEDLDQWHIEDVYDEESYLDDYFEDDDNNRCFDPNCVVIFP